jgi:hypothetical protein
VSLLAGPPEWRKRERPYPKPDEGDTFLGTSVTVLECKKHKNMRIFEKNGLAGKLKELKSKQS